MPTFTTYPRCYLRRMPNEAQRNELSKGDAELLVLWDLYMNCGVDTTTWAYRRRVLTLAMRLFGDFRTWVSIQSWSPAVVGYNLDFIKDTLNYIDTGTRRISVFAWLELVNETEEVAAIGPDHHLNQSSMGRVRPTIDTLQKWCSHPNGFEDLVLSLFLIFGSERSKNVSGDQDNSEPKVISVGAQ